MIQISRLLCAIAVLQFGLVTTSQAAVEKVRAMFRDDPATSFVIGWNQLSGENPVLRYGVADHNQNAASYPEMAVATRSVNFRGMDNRFVRLSGLQPNTRYYFVIEDSEGVSDRYWVLTGPNTREDFTFVTGGDTKSGGNAFLAGQATNRMVAKLRPLFVLFTGDFNSDDGTNEAYWDDWLDNWSSQTTTADGRLTPLVAVHGNHENGDYTTVNKLFDTPDVDSPYSYYSLNFADDLLHLISLNSELQNGDAPAGAFEVQQAWLRNNLSANQDAVFKIAGYHKPLRPHTSSKSEQLFLQQNWAPLFDEYRLTMACESDSHMHKYTFPLTYCEDGESGCFQNFRRNDTVGVFYVGEGSWGAGPRASDDNKPWTIHSQSMNQLKWHKIVADDPETPEVDPRIEVRTVTTVAPGGEDRVDAVEALTEANKYSAIPSNLDLLSLPFFGDHISLPFTTPQGTTPDSPANLAAAEITFSEVHLIWENTSGSEQVANVEIQMRIGADGEWRSIAFLPADASEFLVERLVDDGDHYFRVRALNLFGASDFSNLVLATIPEDTREQMLFIQGYPVNGSVAPYSGAVDLGLLEQLPDFLVDGPSQENPFSLMTADNNSGQGDREQSILRFNGIFNYLPQDAILQQAVLTLVSADATAGIISVHRMLRDWPATATWSTFGVDGIQLNDVDAALDADDGRSSGIEFLQTIEFDVTESVNAWRANPTRNFGWVMVNSSSDGWDTPQSEIPSPLTVPELGVFDVQPRPALTLFYTRLGDINNDGSIDRSDMLAIRNYLRGPGSQCPACDLNGNGIVDVADARLLALKIRNGQ